MTLHLSDEERIARKVEQQKRAQAKYYEKNCERLRAINSLWKKENKERYNKYYVDRRKTLKEQTLKEQIIKCEMLNN